MRLTVTPPGSPDRDGLAVVTVTFDSEQPGAQVRAGTLGTYDSLADLVAQPARADPHEGDAVLLVLTPPTDNTMATAVIDTTDRRLSGISAAVQDRMSVIPLSFGRPEDVVAVS